MTTPQVLRVLLNKFKIENSPDDFALYLVHASGGERKLLHLFLVNCAKTCLTVPRDGIQWNATMVSVFVAFVNKHLL